MQRAVAGWPFSTLALLPPPQLPPSVLEHKRGQKAHKRLSLTTTNIPVWWPPGCSRPPEQTLTLYRRPPRAPEGARKGATTGSSANTPTTSPPPGRGHCTLSSQATGSSLLHWISTLWGARQARASPSRGSTRGSQEKHVTLPPQATCPPIHLFLFPFTELLVHLATRPPNTPHGTVCTASHTCPWEHLPLGTPAQLCVALWKPTL